MEHFFWYVSPFFSDLYDQVIHAAKISAPKALYGLIAAGTDIWVRKLSGKTLGQGYVPATVSVAHLLARSV